MNFLDHQYDLSRTIYSSQHLDLARDFWRGLLEQHDPRWLRKPIGPLSVHWKANGVPAACFLINLAIDLEKLRVHCDPTSHVILDEKIAELLRRKKGRQFEATLTEIQVAALLADRITPITFEPLVPRDKHSAPNKPKSPDYGIVLPDGNVLVEVTVITVGHLDYWDKRAQQIRDQLSVHFKRLSINRIVNSSYPLYFYRNPPSSKQIMDLAEAIANVESGACSIESGEHSLSFTWEPVPIIVSDSEDEFEPPAGGPRVQVVTSGNPANIHSVYGFYGAYQIERNDHEQIFVSAIRNSLKQKRQQFPYEAPLLLAVRLGHSKLKEDVFVPTVINRIWPNPDYCWLAGIALFRPGQRCNKNDQSPRLTLLANPNARSPLPTSAQQVFEQGRQFHYVGTVGRS